MLSVNAQSEENVNSDEDSSHSDCEASSSLPSLRGSLAVLYGLQGVTMQLPILALLAVVNDRVAIPPVRKYYCCHKLTKLLFTNWVLLQHYLDLHF